MRPVNTEHLCNSWQFWQLRTTTFSNYSNLLFLQSQHLDRGGLLRSHQSSFSEILLQVHLSKQYILHLTCQILWSPRRMCMCVWISDHCNQLCFYFRRRYQQKVESRWKGRIPRSREWGSEAFSHLPRWLLPLPGLGDVSLPPPFAQGNWPLKAPHNRYFCNSRCFPSWYSCLPRQVSLLFGDTVLSSWP